MRLRGFSRSRIQFGHPTERLISFTTTSATLSQKNEYFIKISTQCHLTVLTPVTQRQAAAVLVEIPTVNPMDNPTAKEVLDMAAEVQGMAQGLLQDMVGEQAMRLHNIILHQEQIFHRCVGDGLLVSK